MAAKNHPDYQSETRLALLEQTVEHIYEALNRIDKRFDKLDERLDSIETKLDKRIDKLESKVDKHFYWFIGLYITGYGSLLALMAKGFHWY
jgi:uncharacterized coiled-coil protein SlyX